MRERGCRTNCLVQQPLFGLPIVPSSDGNGRMNHLYLIIDKIFQQAKIQWKSPHRKAIIKIYLRDCEKSLDLWTVILQKMEDFT